MGFAKGEALLRRFKRPQWVQFRSWDTSHKRPYIFPTGFGFAFGLIAVLQLMMAIFSQNNLIYLFVFSEISIALSSMFFTNNNMHRVQLSQISVTTSFAHEETSAEVSLINSKPTYQLQARWSFSKMPIPFPASGSQVQIPWTPRRRGYQKLPRLVIESSFPFGLLRAWKVIRSEKEILVFPQRKGNPGFPTTSRGDRSLDQQGLFHDLRPFQRGDWPRRIDWRASQRAQQLLLRRYEEETAMQLDFCWEQTRLIGDFEDRISQLALWIDQAERQGAQYSLQIGNWNSGRSLGGNHWNRCFEYLALLDEAKLS